MFGIGLLATGSGAGTLPQTSSRDLIEGSVRAGRGAPLPDLPMTAEQRLVCQLLGGISPENLIGH